MAIDTRQKRMSMINFADGITIHTLFEADGTIDLDDRQHLLDCYSGIDFQSILVDYDKVNKQSNFDELAG